jgi:hypothetical protein
MKKMQGIDMHLYRASGKLQKVSELKPDFVAYTISINVRCILVLGEFKKSILFEKRTFQQ